MKSDILHVKVFSRAFGKVKFIVFRFCSSLPSFSILIIFLRSVPMRVLLVVLSILEWSWKIIHTKERRNREERSHKLWKLIFKLLEVFCHVLLQIDKRKSCICFTAIHTTISLWMLRTLNGYSFFCLSDTISIVYFLNANKILVILGIRFTRTSTTIKARKAFFHISWLIFLILWLFWRFTLLFPEVPTHFLSQLFLYLVINN